MRIVTSVAAMQRLALQWKRRGTSIGFVPTLGYLHQGHISLVKKARRSVGKRGVVVASIYVNPTQFAPTEDLANYPRDLPRDKELCRDAGVDVLFVPSDKQMYPAWDKAAEDPARGDARPTGFSTYVIEESLSRGMEGESRPTHFRGVTTVVAKLFNIVLPDVAVFGAKDFQQAAVVKRMVRDLHFPVKMVVAPTVREADGLALSSRNKYLSEEEREQAVALWQAIQLARQAVRTSKEAIPSSRLKAELKWLIETRPAARVDYIEFFDPQTLQPMANVQRGAHIALAVVVGKTRLIDNGRL
ncbi:MAG: pantoate--beta-alanine ligase [Verrucomicrobia bacterium]|nr:MAG: pantoate--beta-alanine ligase [Verrucomicrobiota bacterium]